MPRTPLYPLVTLCLAALAPIAGAQTIQPPFDDVYTVEDLGTPPAVPAQLGGLTLEAGDTNSLLIGGAANSAGAAIYQLDLTRECNRISGFAGDAVQWATAPNIDGGLTYHPDGTLFFTRYNINQIGQILPGSTGMDRSDDLIALGVNGSVGAAAFVPPGLPGAGQLKVASFNASDWHTINIAPAGDGTFDVVSASAETDIQGGPEGIVYVPAGSPHFPNDSVLISEYSAGQIGAYEIDANGDPILATRRTFMTGLGGAEGAFRDPATGDFLFSTFGGGNRVLVVRGFSADCPGDSNADNAVNFTDLNAVLAAFGQAGDGLPGDLNADCQVDFGDLNLILARFGSDCGKVAP